MSAVCVTVETFDYITCSLLCLWCCVCVSRDPDINFIQACLELAFNKAGHYYLLYLLV